MARGKGGQADKQRKAMFANMRSRGVGMGKTPQGMNADLQESANVFPNTPANMKEWSKKGGSRRMDIEGIDTKPKDKGISINTKKDNKGIGHKPKEAKNDMGIEDMKHDVTVARLNADNANAKRTQYMKKFREDGKTGIYTDKEYIRLDGQQQDARTAQFDAEQKLQYAKNEAKRLNPPVIDKQFDYKYQYGNDSLGISSRADYEDITDRLGIKTETDAEIRSDYGLRFAEHTDNNWKNMTRAERVRQVVGAQYQKILDDKDAERRRNDPERKKQEEEYRQRQIAAEKFHHDLDNDIY